MASTGERAAERAFERNQVCGGFLARARLSLQPAPRADEAAAAPFSEAGAAFSSGGCGVAKAPELRPGETRVGLCAGPQPLRYGARAHVRGRARRLVFAAGEVRHGNLCFSFQLQLFLKSKKLTRKLKDTGASISVRSVASALLCEATRSPYRGFNPDFSL